MAEPNEKIELGSGRLEAFSDAVFAVIITIMALELRAPQGHTLSDVRDDLLPGLVVYVLSLSTLLGICWNNHHHLLRAAERINGSVMWTNLVLLFWLSLIPVLTEWVRDGIRASCCSPRRPRCVPARRRVRCSLLVA